MNKPKVFWKVVRDRRGRLFSAIVGGAERVQYSRRGWTHPPVAGNRLLVFGSLLAAFEFCNGRSWNPRIFSCQAKDARPQKVLLRLVGGTHFLDPETVTAEDPKGFWKSRMARKRRLDKHPPYPYAMVPEGTWSAAAVKLLEEAK